MHSNNKKVKLPVWDERYEKLGVSPHELYLRQQGLCYLVKKKDNQGNIEIYCTDGKDAAITSGLLNPTFECVKCMTGFMKRDLDEKPEE